MASVSDISRGPDTYTPSLEQVELLYEVTRQFASTLELDVVLGKVLSLTVQSVGASAGSIFLLDQTGRVVRSILARGNLPPEVKYPTVATVMSQGFAGWVYQNRQADIIYDTEVDERWYFFPDDTLVVRAAIATPLIRDDQVIGVLTMTHPQPHWFSQEQLNLLEAIAIQAASAVEKAALYTRVNSERSMLRAVFAGVQDVILVTDLKDRLILANPAAQQNLAISDRDIDKAITRVINEEALIDFYQSAAQEANALREIKLADGRVFDCTLVQVPNVGKILGMHDVTTFKQLDTLKSEFVSQVAHDLKAPLGIIYGYASLLAEMPILNEEEHIYVRPIINAIVRMRALIDNVLDLNRIEMGFDADFEVVDMGGVVRNAFTPMESMAEDKGVTLTQEIAAKVPKVRGVPLRLEQAIFNLVGNAIKFTPEGGSVTVRVGQEDGQVVVRVIDTGPGIPPALRVKLFQKFSKLEQASTSKNEGHGLGLAVVKSVVDAHHGRVWVESQVGVGSTFAFSLPPRVA